MDSDCSHEIEQHSLLGRKAMIKPDSILKSRNITLPTKVHLVKAMIFSSSHAWMRELDHKKAEHRRINVFELWCWRRLLRVSCNARRSNQSILREINSEYSLEALMLKLKLQYFGPLLWIVESLEKSLMQGKIDSKRRRGHQKMRLLDDITNVMDVNLGKLQEMVRDRWPGVLQSIGSQRIGHDWVTEQ